MKSTSAGYTDADYARQGQHLSSRSDRDQFEVDKGRIIHSAAFRRLQGKTQVLGVGERDFYRTRLTHSLEVAQLARGLCRELEGDFEPNRDLVEAISLAHDIGHPPFGHSGEDYLHEKMKGNRGGFGANPQNLRIVALLEAKYLNFGLDLTRATLDGLVKYPTVYTCTQDKGSKFTYAEDAALLAWIKKDVKNPENLPIEAQLADWADQMAYSVNDIEDIARAGLLSFVEMNTRAGEISHRATEKLTSRLSGSGQYTEAQKTAAFKITSANSVKDLASDLENKYAKPTNMLERKMNLKKWTSDTIKLLNKGKIIDAKNGEVSVRYRYRLQVSAKAMALAEMLKATAYILVFSNPRVTTLESKGRHIIQALFDRFSEAKGESLLPLDFKQLIDAKKFGSKERLIADFISGMTDRYAYAYYARLFLPGSGSFYEYV